MACDAERVAEVWREAEGKGPRGKGGFAHRLAMQGHAQRSVSHWKNHTAPTVYAAMGQEAANHPGPTLHSKEVRYHTILARVQLA